MEFVEVDRLMLLRISDERRTNTMSRSLKKGPYVDAKLLKKD